MADEKRGIDWGGMFIPAPPDLNQEALHDNLAESAELKRQADDRKAYVLEHFRRLRGVFVPIEIMGIQNLPHHNCLIINDLLLLSYAEAEQIIRGLNHDDDDRNHV